MAKATLERRAFVNGLFGELRDQVERYHDLSHEWLEMQGRMEVSEKAVRIVRDHLQAAMEGSEEEVPPHWQKVLDKVRFVGMRTADACLVVLKERGKLTTEELLSELNAGAFRFNSPYPLRELNAAMLRHPHVKRDGDCWTYEPPAPKVLRPRREKEERAS